MHKIVLFDKNYVPIGIISWKKAINLICREKVEPVGKSFLVIKTMDNEVKIPKFLRLLNIIKNLYHRIVPCRKKTVFIRDKYTCLYCGKKISHPTLDHILPKSRGGKSIFENLATSCFECNQKKGNKTPREVNMRLLYKPKSPTVIEHIKNVILHYNNYDENIEDIIDREFKLILQESQ